MAPARIAIILALAHKLPAAIDTGLVANQSEVARLLGMSSARVSQILDLTLLAPRIQETILERVREARVEGGGGEGEGETEPDAVAEAVGTAARAVAWREQGAAFGGPG